MVLSHSQTQSSNSSILDMDSQAINPTKTHMETLLNKNEENLQQVVIGMQEMKQQFGIQKTT